MQRQDTNKDCSKRRTQWNFCEAGATAFMERDGFRSWGGRGRAGFEALRIRGAALHAQAAGFALGAGNSRWNLARVYIVDFFTFWTGDLHGSNLIKSDLKSAKPPEADKNAS